MNESQSVEAVESFPTEVIARDGMGHEYGRGVAVAYSMVPTLTIRRPDGSTFSWRHDMCERADRCEP